MSEITEEKKSVLASLFWPLVFSFIIWAVKLSEVIFETNLAQYGLMPRTLKGLFGILTLPFIHGDFLHLISNTIPVIILGGALFYFYKELAYRVFFLIYILSGAWVWLAGRPYYHIGASGIVYGLAFFLFLSGIFRKDRSLMAFSLLVVFLYGSIIWGILPVESGMSWEGHLFGALSGIICAIAFKNDGPQRKRYEWEDEEDEDNDLDNDNVNYTEVNNKTIPPQITYTIIPEEKKDDDKNERD